MGYNTTILFLNDAYSEIERNPEQVIRNILDAMKNWQRQPKTYPIGCYANPMEAMPTQHADIPRLYLTCGNAIHEFGSSNDESRLKIRKRLLKMAKELLKDEADEIKRLEANRS